MSGNADASRLIVGAVYDGALSLDLIGPLEAFNIARRELSAQSQSSYDIVIASIRPGPVRTLSGVQLIAEKALSDFEKIDTLIMPGMATGDYAYRNSGVVEWLRGAAANIRRIASVCSGAFIAGEAGLLDNRSVTTHWMDCDELREIAPKARVQDNRIYIKDGDIYSSGGITAGIDLALALIEEDYGRALALKVARRMVVFLKRQGDQSQFSELLNAQTQSTRFSSLIDWIETALGEPLNVDLLAAKANMSPRNFTRQFQAEIGVSPMKYVIARRIERARLLLEESAKPLSRIAAESGFTTDEKLRRAFQRAFGTSPSDYRRRFGLN